MCAVGRNLLRIHALHTSLSCALARVVMKSVQLGEFAFNPTREVRRESSELAGRVSSAQRASCGASTPRPLSHPTPRNFGRKASISARSVSSYASVHHHDGAVSGPHRPVGCGGGDGEAGVVSRLRDVSRCFCRCVLVQDLRAWAVALNDLNDSRVSAALGI